MRVQCVCVCVHFIKPPPHPFNYGRGQGTSLVLKAGICWGSNIVTAGHGCESVDAISTCGHTQVMHLT